MPDPDYRVLVREFAPEVLAAACELLRQYMATTLLTRGAASVTEVRRAEASRRAAQAAIDEALRYIKSLPVRAQHAALLANDDPDVRTRALARLHALPAE